MGSGSSVVHSVAIRCRQVNRLARFYELQFRIERELWIVGSYGHAFRNLEPISCRSNAVAVIHFSPHLANDFFLLDILERFVSGYGRHVNGAAYASNINHPLLKCNRRAK